MGHARFFRYSLLLVSFLLLRISFAQTTSDCGLPDGARARLRGGGVIGNIEYSPNGAQLAAGSSIGIMLYDVQTGDKIPLCAGDAWRFIAFSPDGLMIAGRHGSRIQVWNSHSGKSLYTLNLEGSVGAVAISPDWRTLATSGAYAAGRGNQDSTIRLWDVHTGNRLHTLTGHTDVVSSVTFSPDGLLVASGSWDGTVRLWDARTGLHLKTISGSTGEVNTVVFSPGGLTIASGSGTQGETSTGDNAIRLWDTRTGEHLRTLKGHTNWVTSAAFSPDGLTLVSGSWDGTIRLWDIRTGKGVRTIEVTRWHVDSVVFSPDGLSIAGDSSVGLRLWDSHSGKLLKTLLRTRARSRPWRSLTMGLCWQVGITPGSRCGMRTVGNFGVPLNVLVMSTP